MVLNLVPIIATSSLGEPAFDATREEAAAFSRKTAETSWAMRQEQRPFWDFSR
jgi:hypothetical protein